MPLNKINKVAIFGDSWSYSSWKKGADLLDEIDDLKLQDMFHAVGINATNYSMCGGTNVDTVSILNEVYRDYEHLIVFQTDPVRQCLNKNSISVREDLKLPTSQNFLDLCENLLGDFYQDLLAVDRPVLLIGGCTKLCKHKIRLQFKVVDKSWSEIAHVGFEDNYYYWCEETLCLYDHCKKFFGWETEEFFSIEEQIKDKNYLWQTSNMFSWCHAATSAYRLMFSEIERILYDHSQSSNP